MSFWRGLHAELAERLSGRTSIEDKRSQWYTDTGHRGFSVESAVSDTLANLACSGFLLDIGGESERAEMIREVAEDFSQTTIVDMMAIGMETGDCLVVPTWNGNRFQNALIGRRDFRIMAVDQNDIRAVAFIVDERYEREKHYRLVEVMALEPYVSQDGQTRMGCHYTLHKLKGDKPTRDHIDGWEEYDYDWWVADVDRLLLGRYKSHTRDKGHPNSVYGIPVCYNASQPIKEIHYLMDQLHNEFEFSEKAIFANKAVFAKDGQGNLILPRGKDRLFMATRGGAVDDSSIKEWAPSIQAQAYIEALEVQKRNVEKLIGVDDGIISTPNTQNYANVDHVRKSMRNTQAFINRARGVANQAIDDLLYSWDVLLNHYGYPTGEYSRDRDWSDEYIETFADKRDALIAGYGIGATDALDFRQFVLSEAPEVAEQRVAEIQASRQVSVFDEE